ncbi:tripartite tricarboxylate transporter substrate binding protein [Hydrogenophaga sp.]|uniref:tripartite tricarboxylate transporter substrate binding protein n=1 Tax=Hydrogenophaga sp. TaxID=1904254 RepID=UPI00271C1ABD|nr:tripartite tricarboxylate transporter substrate binding protein [Hydrogenophaga sp.]MDO9134200.1 tripartite tricarboxylate transporter substrate binding protein [Hydrogenophaga sp.]
MKRRNFISAIAGASAATMLPFRTAQAQEFPSKPIYLIVPFAPGGPTDILARLIGQKLSVHLNTAVVIENKAGANSIIATEYVAKSPADGYTLLVGSPATASNISLYKKLPYDTLKDLSPVTPIASTPYFLIVNGMAPYNTVQELIAYAKVNPTGLAYASAGAGGPLHLTAELFNTSAGIKMLHVPYRGVGPALLDLVANRVQVIFAGLPSTRALIEEKKLKLLAVADRQRTSFMPNLPTIHEAGLRDFAADSWFGLFARAGTPAAVEEQLAAAVRSVLSEPDVRERMAGLGAVPLTSSPSEFRSFFRADVTKWAEVIKVSGATAEM